MKDVSSVLTLRRRQSRMSETKDLGPVVGVSSIGAFSNDFVTDGFGKKANERSGLEILSGLRAGAVTTLLTCELKSGPKIHETSKEGGECLGRTHGCGRGRQCGKAGLSICGGIVMMGEQGRQMLFEVCPIKSFTNIKQGTVVGGWESKHNPVQALFCRKVHGGCPMIKGM